MTSIEWYSCSVLLKPTACISSLLVFQYSSSIKGFITSLNYGSRDEGLSDRIIPLTTRFIYEATSRAVIRSHNYPLPRLHSIRPLHSTHEPDLVLLVHSSWTFAKVIINCIRHGRIQVWSYSPFSHQASSRILADVLLRQELLGWMNNLLQLNVTKVEQCGTG